MVWTAGIGPVCASPWGSAPGPEPIKNRLRPILLTGQHDQETDRLAGLGAKLLKVGAALGGGISFLLSQQQAKEARRQRQEDDLREHRRRSADRRFQAYADFLTRARSFRNAVKAYYERPRHRPPLAELDGLLQSANDASALVFLVVESEATHQGCRAVLRALGKARSAMQGSGPAGPEEPWAELDVMLGRATREFQNSARIELEVAGPTISWDSPVSPAEEA